MIQHLILTRNNYADAELGKRRAEITEWNTRPSILRQTCQNFTWVQTANHPVREGDWWESCVVPFLKPETTHVLTTRLDDDDILADNFVERLQQAATETERPTCYVFPNGIITDGERFGRMWHTSNMFCSLLSPVDERLTVYEKKHGNMPRSFATEQMDSELAWAWYRHPDAITAESSKRYKMPWLLSELVNRFPGTRLGVSQNGGGE